jgi:capsular polysaccharide biosynthesis protein
MSLKKKLQQFFKKFAQEVFFLIYGKITIKKDYNFLDQNSLNKIDPMIIDNIRYNCFTITNGRIYTDLVENVAIISNNILIPGACFQKINGNLVNEKSNICLKKGTPRIKVRKNGKLLALIQDASENNYSHWLLDILPRIKIFEENNSIEQIDHFLFPELKHSFQYETLKILDIPLNKVISDKKNRHIESETLIATDHPWHKKGNIHDEMKNIPEWIILWLREKFLKYSENTNICDKIYIDRSDSLFNHCQIINSKEVWQFLKEKGFKRFKLSEINFKNQIGLFNSARIIIGAHGAGLSNIIFSKPETKVIEIRPENHVNEVFSKISKINNLNYKKILSNHSRLSINNKIGNILVNIDDISKLLD